MSNDSFSVQLDDAGDWFLGADSMQWIIARRRVSKDTEVMQGQSFIGSDKTVLHRCIRSHGITLSAEAKERLDSFPDTFQNFVAIYQTVSGKGRKKQVDIDD